MIVSTHRSASDLLVRAQNASAYHLRSIAAWNPARFLPPRSEDNAEAVVGEAVSIAVYPDDISPGLDVDSGNASRAAGVSASYLWLRLVSRKKRRQ